MGTLLGCSWKGSSRRGLERVSTSRRLVFWARKILPFRTFGALQVSILSNTPEFPRTTLGTAHLSLPKREPRAEERKGAGPGKSGTRPKLGHVKKDSRDLLKREPESRGLFSPEKIFVFVPTQEKGAPESLFSEQQAPFFWSRNIKCARAHTGAKKAPTRAFSANSTQHFLV